MIPLRDEKLGHHVPYVNLLLIGINLAVFVWQLTLGPRSEAIFVHQYGVVPGWLTGLDRPELPDDWLPRFTTLISYQFLHGGFFHLAGNMLYLWIFGDNLEMMLGRLRYLAFYLLGGVLAAASQVLSGPGSGLPMIGASGSIAAVLGGYLLLFPRNQVQVLFWLIFFVRVIKVPAVLLLGLWFLLQVMGAGGPGVAWMAHIGGFVAGILMVRRFLPQRRRVTLH